MSIQTFTFINDSRICEIIESTQNHLIYAAPSLSKTVAKALLGFAGRNDEGFRIIVDANAESFQLGFGDFEGIGLLNQNNIEIRKAKGLRIAVLIADELAWVYSPTPEIIFEQPDNKINNAVSVTKDFAQQILVSIAPEFNVNQDILDTNVLPDSQSPEIGAEILETCDLKEIAQELEINPPQQFDAKRKVRVYEGYFQFVEIHLSGCQIGSHKISIPKSLLNIAKTPDLKHRIQTTFQLVNKDSVILSKFDAISDAVNELREKTDVIGRYGRIILRRIRNEFDKRVEEIRAEIKVLQETVNAELSAEILSSHEKLVTVLQSGVKENPPPALQKRAFFGEVSDDLVKEFILEELNKISPKTENLIKEMQLNCDYKNITYEMLNDSEFIEKVKEKYPNLEKLYEEDEAIKAKQITMVE